MNQRKLKGVNYRNQSTIAKLLMCAFRFVIPFPSFVVGTRGTSDDIYSQTTDSAASLMQSVAWPPPGLCARCGVQGLPGVPCPPGLRPGSMAPRFPSWGGQGSWHAGRMQPACSQVSRVSCSQRLSHPLPQVKNGLGLDRGQLGEDLCSISSDSQLNMQSIGVYEAQKGEKQSEKKTKTNKHKRCCCIKMWCYFIWALQSAGLLTPEILLQL